MKWIPRVSLIALAFAALGVVAAAQPAQTSITAQEATLRVRRALERLPYYGVFDFLAFSVDRGTVTLMGYAYRPTLKSEAEQAVKRIPGVDEVANKIEILPPSQNDDRIRWATFYNIYTDDFLSRYAPGGPTSARYAALEHAFNHFPGMEPFGMYPIQIIVKNGRITLLGLVDNDADKTIAGVQRAAVSDRVERGGNRPGRGRDGDAGARSAHPAQIAAMTSPTEAAESDSGIFRPRPEDFPIPARRDPSTVVTHNSRDGPGHTGCTRE